MRALKVPCVWHSTALPDITVPATDMFYNFSDMYFLKAKVRRQRGPSSSTVSSNSSTANHQARLLQVLWNLYLKRVCELIGTEILVKMKKKWILIVYQEALSRDLNKVQNIQFLDGNCRSHNIGVFHVFHVNRSVNIFLLNRKFFYVTKIC